MLDLRATLRPAAVSLAVWSGVLGLAYPLLIGVLGAAAFPATARGSLDLIGQPFTDPAYFWSRPSAGGYDAMASGGTNAAPSSPALVADVRARIAALRAADPGNQARVPVDLVTASGSGLDPHISPAAARYQLARVARARGVAVAAIEPLLARATEPRTLGVLGEPRVNVVVLNRAIDVALGRPTSAR